MLELFSKPKKRKAGLKVLAYGKEGTGKTLFALTFPSIALIDAESGSTFYQGTEDGKNIVLVANTQNFKEYSEAIEAIGEVAEEQGILTFVTDSLTKIRQNLSDAVLTVDIKRNRRNGLADADLNSNISQRSWGTIGNISKRQQNQKIDLSNSVNIVDIAQEANVTNKDGEVIGVKPDIDKAAPYDYDIKLRFITKEKSDGTTQFLAIVEKDRTKTFKSGDVIESPSYDLWAHVLDDRKDSDTITTSYTDGIDNAKKSYEKDVENDEKDLLEQIKDMKESLPEEEYKAMSDEIKKARLTKVASLSVTQREKLKGILDKYRK